MSESQSKSKGSSGRPRRERGIRESLVAIVLGFEAIVVGLGALTMLGLRSIDLVQAIVGGGLVIAVLIAGALLARFTIGIVLGWLAQAAVMATGFIVGAMFVVGIVFTAMWVYALVQGGRVDRAKNARNSRQSDGEDPPR
jgi:fatty acid desaturase